MVFDYLTRFSRIGRGCAKVCLTGRKKRPALGEASAAGLFAWRWEGDHAEAEESGVLGRD
jgi:hypothetical protein